MEAEEDAKEEDGRGEEVERVVAVEEEDVADTADKEWVERRAAVEVDGVAMINEDGRIAEDSGT